MSTRRLRSMGSSVRYTDPRMAKSNQPHKTIASVPAAPGPVMIIGGAEDKLRDRVILTRFVSLAGGSDSPVVVISTASSLGDAAPALYRELFTHMGAGRV